MNYQRADTIANYQATGYVYHYDRQNGANAAYQFEGIWPSNISAIDLAWDSNDTAEEYTVEFQVQYWGPQLILTNLMVVGRRTVTETAEVEVRTAVDIA